MSAVKDWNLMEQKMKGFRRKIIFLESVFKIRNKNSRIKKYEMQIISIKMQILPFPRLPN